MAPKKKIDLTSQDSITEWQNHFAKIAQNELTVNQIEKIVSILGEIQKNADLQNNPNLLTKIILQFPWELRLKTPQEMNNNLNKNLNADIAESGKIITFLKFFFLLTALPGAIEYFTKNPLKYHSFSQESFTKISLIAAITYFFGIFAAIQSTEKNSAAEFFKYFMAINWISSLIILPLTSQHKLPSSDEKKALVETGSLVPYLEKIENLSKDNKISIETIIIFLQNYEESLIEENYDFNNSTRNLM